MKENTKITNIRSRNWVVLKVLVFIGIILFLYWRLSNENWTTVDALHLKYPWAIALSFLLIFANQGIEWVKWKLVASRLVSDVAIIRKSFFGGIAAGFVTPNGWGNFLGRMVFFRKRDRMYIILASFLSNASQVLPTLFFGALACSFSDRMPVFAFWSAISIAILLITGFFFGERLMPKKKPRNRLMRHFQLTQERLSALRLPLFLWSTLRYHIFSIQFALLFVAFGYTDFWFLLYSVWLIYVLTSFIPSLWSGKIVIRETAAIFVFTGSSVAIPDVIVVSLLIWLFNIVLPAAISSFVWIPVSKTKTNVVD